jgi:hypothetical protein
VIPSTFAGATRSTIVASGRGSHEDHHVDGEDLRRAPLELRKARLRGLLQLGHPGIAFNTHYIDGAIVFKTLARSRRVKAPRLAISFRPLDSMGKSEEPECTGGET